MRRQGITNAGTVVGLLRSALVTAAATIMAGCSAGATDAAMMSARAPLHAHATLSVAPPVPMTAEAAIADMAAGRLTSEALTRRYLARIATLDDAGPRINAVIATFPDAIEQARALDAERRAGRVRGPLHGLPILLKDNIEAIGPVPTTAGSLALAGNVTNRDAAIVASLRAAGAVILGKTNLSEWANIRSGRSTSGWSAVGGQTRNPWVLDRNPCGSSAGSGAAMAMRFAAMTVGTETDGSIVCPAGVNGVVGFKPTVGLASRRHIIPISERQDTAGPMVASVHDAALMMDAIARTDPGDARTVDADRRRPDSFVDAARAGTLNGRRIGVMRDRVGDNPALVTALDLALERMRAAGAILVEIKDTQSGLDGLGDAEFDLLMIETRATIDAYLATRPAMGGVRSLADVVAFNKANAATEMRWFGQDLFDLALTKPGTDSRAFADVRDKAFRLAGPEGIDRLLRDHRVDALVGLTNGPAWVTDLVNGDSFSGPSSSQLAAVAGYPHLSVPMALVEGLPVGLSIIGGQWRDADVLALGAAFERARGPIRDRPTLRPTIRADR